MKKRGGFSDKLAEKIVATRRRFAAGRNKRRVQKVNAARTVRAARQRKPVRSAGGRAAANRGGGSIGAAWGRVKAGWNGFFSGKVAWLNGKVAAMIAAGLVVCIAAPIVIASAVNAPKESVKDEIVVSARGNGETAEPTEAANAADTEKSGQAGDVQPQDGTAEPVQQMAAAEPEPTATPDPTPTPFPVLQTGVDSPKVSKLQERLMDLGYMDLDEPTEHFGSMTKTAVQLFQRKHELDTDGCVGELTWNAIFSKDAKKYTVSVGITGTDVEELQKRLRELGYIDTVTSYFGTDTEAAVKKFQERNGLTVDGSVGSETREMLYSEDAKAYAIEYGTESDKVKQLQQRLYKLGYITQVTGLYGPETQQAIKRFQERNGLIADGAMGPVTQSTILSADAQPNALIVGTSGADVEKVQNRLVELKYMKNATGYYGSDTEAAVSAFQKRNGLTADGKVGAQTNKVLFSDGAKKAASTSSSSGKPGNSGASSTKKPSSSSSGKKPSSGSSGSSGTNVVADEASVSALIKVAKSKLGCKYVRGAKGPNSFDCSGFVYWCLKQIGVKQGYMTSGGWAGTSKYPTVTKISDIKAGDIICFRGHVGIAIGGGKMIDASSGQGKIRITGNIGSSSYWKRNFIKACRVL